MVFAVLLVYFFSTTLAFPTFSFFNHFKSHPSLLIIAEEAIVAVLAVPQRQLQNNLLLFFQLNLILKKKKVGKFTLLLLSVNWLLLLL